MPRAFDQWLIDQGRSEPDLSEEASLPDDLYKRLGIVYATCRSCDGWYLYAGDPKIIVTVVDGYHVAHNRC